MSQRTWWSFTLILMMPVAFAGCGDAQPYTIVPVAGTVTLDGKPLADARVVFQPMKSTGEDTVGPGSVGNTNEDGRFVLETVDRHDGAVVATHMVRITTSKIYEEPGSDETTMTRETVPPHYRYGFKVEVKGATDDLPIELSSRPAARP